LRQNTKECFYQGRYEEFKNIFSKECLLEFCNDICAVMVVVGHEHNTDQRPLFTYSLKVTLKLVLHQNGNKFPSVLLAHADNMKKSYESMKLLLGMFINEEIVWYLFGDLKFVHVLSECISVK
jgi:hypothetical protein